MLLIGLVGGTGILLGALGLAQWVQAMTERQAAIAFLARACPREAAPDGPPAILRWWRETPLAGRIQAGLDRAGLPWRSEHAVLVWTGGTLLSTWLLYTFFPFTLLAAFIWSTLVVQLGWLLFLRMRRASWDASFRAALPGNVRLMANILRAGRSLPRALEQAGQEGVPPCAGVWRRMAQEMALGESLHACLARTVKRLPLSELQWIAALMAVLYESGGDLPAALDEVASAIEAEEQARQEMWNLTADARSVAFILPGMGVALLFVMGTVIPNFFAVLFQPIGLIVLALFALVQTGILFLVRYVAQVRL